MKLLSYSAVLTCFSLVMTNYSQANEKKIVSTLYTCSIHVRNIHAWGDKELYTTCATSAENAEKESGPFITEAEIKYPKLKNVNWHFSCKNLNTECTLATSKSQPIKTQSNPVSPKK